MQSSTRCVCIHLKDKRKVQRPIEMEYLATGNKGGADLRIPTSYHSIRTNQKTATAYIAIRQRFVHHCRLSGIERGVDNGQSSPICSLPAFPFSSCKPLGPSLQETSTLFISSLGWTSQTRTARLPLHNFTTQGVAFELGGPLTFYTWSSGGILGPSPAFPNVCTWFISGV